MCDFKHEISTSETDDVLENKQTPDYTQGKAQEWSKEIMVSQKFAE